MHCIPKRRTCSHTVSFHPISLCVSYLYRQYLVQRGPRISNGRWTSFQCYVIKGAQYATRRRTCSHTVILYPISLCVGSTDDEYLVLHGSGISKGRRTLFQRYVIKSAQDTPRRRTCPHTVSFHSIPLFVGSSDDGYLVLHGSVISKCRRTSFQRYVIKGAQYAPREESMLSHSHFSFDFFVRGLNR